MPGFKKSCTPFFIEALYYDELIVSMSRAQDQITALKEEIAEENEIFAELEKNMDELETLLLEIKRLLYELCKLLDVSEN